MVIARPPPPNQITKNRYFQTSQNYIEKTHKMKLMLIMNILLLTVLTENNNAEMVVSYKRTVFRLHKLGLSTRSAKIVSLFHKFLRLLTSRLCQIWIRMAWSQTQAQKWINPSYKYFLIFPLVNKVVFEIKSNF